MTTSRRVFLARVAAALAGTAALPAWLRNARDDGVIVDPRVPPDTAYSMQGKLWVPNRRMVPVWDRVIQHDRDFYEFHVRGTL